jgi:hypothetical protein
VIPMFRYVCASDAFERSPVSTPFSNNSIALS